METIERIYQKIEFFCRSFLRKINTVCVDKVVVEKKFHRAVDYQPELTRYYYIR